MNTPVRRALALLLLAVLAVPARPAQLGGPKSGPPGPSVPAAAPETPAAAPGLPEAPGGLALPASAPVPASAQAPVLPVSLAPEARRSPVPALAGRPPATARPAVRVLEIAPGVQAVVIEASPEDLPGALSGIYDGEGPQGPPASAVAAEGSEVSPRSLFLAARPGSRAVETLERQGYDFERLAAEFLIHDSFQVRSAEPDPLERDPVRAALGEILELSREAAAPSPARSFVRGLGSLAARWAHEAFDQARRGAKYMRMMGFDPEPPHRLPPNPLGAGDYWDLAAGINAGTFIMDSLEPGTRYHFFERSPFVASYLEEIKRLVPPGGAEVVVHERDIWTLARPERPIAVLRAKNVTAYVRGFERKLEEMTDWIVEGGRFIVQTDAESGQLGAVVGDLGGLAERLIEEGWAFDYRLAPRGDLDLLTFTRPGAGPLPGAGEPSRRRWRELVRDAEGFHPFAALGRLFGYGRR